MNAEQPGNQPRPPGADRNRRTTGPLADQLDCGDGVPSLLLTAQKPLADGAGCGLNQGRGITAKQFALGMTIVGQLLLALAVLAGGSALIGLLAAAVLLACGLTLIAVEVMGAGNHPDRHTVLDKLLETQR